MVAAAVVWNDKLLHWKTKYTFGLMRNICGGSRKSVTWLFEVFWEKTFKLWAFFGPVNWPWPELWGCRCRKQQQLKEQLSALVSTFELAVSSWRPFSFSRPLTQFFSSSFSRPPIWRQRTDWNLTSPVALSRPLAPSVALPSPFCPSPPFFSSSSARHHHDDLYSLRHLPPGHTGRLGWSGGGPSQRVFSSLRWDRRWANRGRWRWAPPHWWRDGDCCWRWSLCSPRGSSAVVVGKSALSFFKQHWSALTVLT